MQQRIDIVSLGCSKNLVDSEFLIKQLENAGFKVFHDAENPVGKIVIINTCGFIGDAKEESINLILAFAQRKQQKKINKLLVMGCLSQRYKDELQAEIPEVDKFYGKFEFNKIVEDLGKCYNENLRLHRTLTTNHFAYVKIAEGCNQACSYCAIPIITGRHKSRPIEEIEQEIKLLTQKGIKEFQLIAQDLTFYGKDLYGKKRLADLIARLSDIKGVEWLRLHYAYPTAFPYEILPLIRERENVCNYLDIALQHISNNILQLMRRKITSEQTYELIERIRTEVPNIALRTTLLVGHPNETEKDFAELIEFVNKVKFERLGVFAYSHEDGTFAFKHYQDNVPPEVKQQRVEVLMEEQRLISAEKNAQKVGQTLKVIIDNKLANCFIGRTEFDSPEVDGEVYIEKVAQNRKLQIGDFCKVKVMKSDDYDLFGEVVE